MPLLCWPVMAPAGWWCLVSRTSNAAQSPCCVTATRHGSCRGRLAAASTATRAEGGPREHSRAPLPRVLFPARFPQPDRPNYSVEAPQRHPRLGRPSRVLSLAAPRPGRGHGGPTATWVAHLAPLRAAGGVPQRRRRCGGGGAEAAVVGEEDHQAHQQGTRCGVRLQRAGGGGRQRVGRPAGCGDVRRFHHSKSTRQVCGGVAGLDGRLEERGAGRPRVHRG